MTTQNWSQFPKTYIVTSGLSDDRKVATLEELEEVIELVLEGKLGELDSNSNSYWDVLKLLEIIVDRDMPARALDPQSETGIYKPGLFSAGHEEPSASRWSRLRALT